jgi:ribosomal protein L22
MSPAPKKPADAEEPEVEATEEAKPAAKKPAAKKPAAKKPAAAKAKAEAKPAAEKEPAAEKPAAAEKKPAETEKAEEPKEPAKPAARPSRSRTRTPESERVTVRAHAKYVRTSARKARLVCDHIRGKSVVEARAILSLTPRHVARDWSKLLESAVANAENNHELLGDDLKIYSVTADEGPTLKRFRPRAMGRATPIRKRTSHLTILLTPKER